MTGGVPSIKWMLDEHDLPEADFQRLLECAARPRQRPVASATSTDDLDAILSASSVSPYPVVSALTAWVTVHTAAAAIRLDIPKEHFLVAVASGDTLELGAGQGRLRHPSLRAGVADVWILTDSTCVPACRRAVQIVRCVIANFVTAPAV
jgi:hypothetical protein